jgi:ribosomal protein S18 acetylase RimI-like enzyme
MDIRAAARSDLATLEALFEEVDAFHRVRLPDRFRAPDVAPRPHDYLLALVEGTDRTVLLAEDSGTAVGFVTLEVRDAPPFPLFVPRRIGIIDALGVRTSSRRRGIGRALMAGAETWLREHGANDVELTVYDANPEATAFYEAIGYSVLLRRMSRRL